MRLWQIWEECTESLRHLGGKVGSGGWEDSGGPGGTSQHCTVTFSVMKHFIFLIIFAFPRNGFTI